VDVVFFHFLHHDLEEIALFLHRVGENSTCELIHETAGARIDSLTKNPISFETRSNLISHRQHFPGSWRIVVQTQRRKSDTLARCDVSHTEDDRKRAKWWLQIV
jgi:predicted sugar kinase